MAAEEAAEEADEADGARSQPSASPTRDGLRPLQPLQAQPGSAASLLLGGKAAGERPASIAALLSNGPSGEEETRGGASGWKLTGATVGEQASATEPRRRQHIFISSQPGVGKTTLVRKLLDMLRKEEGETGVVVAGFYTEEVRDAAGQRSGFDIVRLGGGSSDAPARIALARHGEAPPKVGKYSVDLETFEAFAIPTLETPDKAAPVPEEGRLYTHPDGREEAVRFLREKPTPLIREAVPDFVQAGSFGGKRQGYYFSTGDRGLGYYRDAQQELPPAEVDEKDDEDICIVLVPSTRKEAEVPASQLRPIPEDWAPPASGDEDEIPRLCVCDEVGKMELLSLKFPAAFLTCLDTDAVVLGTLPQPQRGQRDHEVIDRVKRRADVRIVKLTRHNRDELVDKTYATLRASLGLGPPGAGNPVAERRKAAERALKEQQEAKERETKAKQEAKEREKQLRKEKQAAKEKQRAAKAKRLAKKKEAQAKDAREVLSFAPAVWVVFVAQKKEEAPAELGSGEAKRNAIAFSLFLLGFYFLEDVVTAFILLRELPLRALSHLVHWLMLADLCVFLLAYAFNPDKGARTLLVRFTESCGV